MEESTMLLWLLQADFLMHPWRRMENGFGGCWEIEGMVITGCDNEVLSQWDINIV